jgi:hypothetical protein
MVEKKRISEAAGGENPDQLSKAQRAKLALYAAGANMMMM